MPKSKRYTARLTVGFTTDQAIFLGKLEKQNDCASIGQVLRMLVNDAMREAQKAEPCPGDCDVCNKPNNLRKLNPECKPYTGATE